MDWFGLAFGVLVVVGTTVVFFVLHNPKNAHETVCCHCGQCMVSGECVIARKNAEKRRARLDKMKEKDIISSVNT